MENVNIENIELRHFEYFLNNVSFMGILMKKSKVLYLEIPTLL